MYSKDIDWIYANYTPRKDRSGLGFYVFFGLQFFCLKLNKVMEEGFFGLPKEQALNQFKADYKEFTGKDNEEVYQEISDTWDLGYLPITIKAVKEGTIFQTHGIPPYTIESSFPDKRFKFIVNWVESWMSAEIWHASCSATTAVAYRKIFTKYAEISSDDMWFVDFQGHDFSFRGQTSLESAQKSGAAHLTSFKGTDTCPAISWIKTYYPENNNELLGTSVFADEHSICSTDALVKLVKLIREEEYNKLTGETIPISKERELELRTTAEKQTIIRLLTEVIPDDAIFSHVSDTYDLWQLVTRVMADPKVKSLIMSRSGKFVVRPDSGDPHKIICGDSSLNPNSPEGKGLIRCLGEIFGSNTNSKGYQTLDPHVGAIYGDSITLELAEAMCSTLVDNKWASTNVVLGIGSYTYQMVTRDTHGVAIKTTACGTAEGIIPVYKDPKTDLGGKKSAFGLLKVTREGNTYTLHENVTKEEADTGELKLFYKDMEIVNLQSFVDVRNTIQEHLV
jgi:nicotinamide phosphoribosyltransferase